MASDIATGRTQLKEFSFELFDIYIKQLNDCFQESLRYYKDISIEKGIIRKKSVFILISNLHKKGTRRKCDALHDLVPFVQFKKREKHLRGSVTFSKGFSLQLY